MLRVAFMGSPDFAVPALRAVLARHRVTVVVTQTDKAAGRGRQMTSSPVKQVAVEAGVPVLEPKSARKPEFLAALADHPADIGVVVAYGKILPRGVLEAFPHGCLNIHGSLLPAYRGAAPVQWAVIHGEPTTGITIMRLDEGMDTGPMLSQRSVEIGAEETAGQLLERLAPLGAEMLLEALDAVESGTARFTPQDDARASYAPMLKKEDGQVDWQQPATAVASRIRGVDPWPGAVTTLGGDPLKLFGAVAVEGAPGAAAGAVLGVDAGGLRVACGAGAVRIAEVQAAGRKRMAAVAFAAGRSLAAGTVLGG